MVKPKCLKTIKEYVFLPTEHIRVEAILTQLVSAFTELFIYSSIYNQRTLRQTFREYKALFESVTEPAVTNFQIKLFESLDKNFNLNRLKAFTDKNLFEI
jgi:hypothetical protein